MQEHIEKGIGRDDVEVETFPDSDETLVHSTLTVWSPTKVANSLADQPEMLEFLGTQIRKSMALKFYGLAQELDPEMVAHEFTKAKMEVVKHHYKTGEYGVFNA